MPCEDGIGWAWVTNSVKLKDEKALLWGLMLLTSVTGGDITVYSGHDSGSGRLVCRMEAIANHTEDVMFVKPLLLEGGLFIEIGSNVTGVLVLYE